MNANTLPIIKLEVEGMKHAIKVALSQHTIEIDAHIQAAINEYCTDDNLQTVIVAATKAAIDNVVKDEITRFFEYGDGRKAVSAAIEETILSHVKKYKSQKPTDISENETFFVQRKV